MKTIPVQQNKPLILVVDDEPSMLSMYTAFLEAEGFIVKGFRKSGESIRAFMEMKPDIVILDLMMPDLNGFAVCRALRSLPGSAEIPILVVTGLEDSKSIRQALEAGATDFIVKPANPDILSARIQYMLRARRTLRELRQNEDSLKLLKEAVESMPIGITISDVEGKIIYTNPAEAQLHGYTREELTSKEVWMLAPPALRKPIPPEEFEKLSVWKRETVNIRRKGGDFEEFPVYLTSIPVRNAQGVPLGIITTCEDITERKASEREIGRLAYHDSVTGLPNRMLLQDRLNNALSLARREGRELCVMFFDLDSFKDVNDSQGHDFGDRLLGAVGQRLLHSLREADTVARLGGDEFVAVLPSISDRKGAAHAAERILSLFEEPFYIGERSTYTSVSIGIALYPGDGKDTASLLSSADLAMYHAKSHGRQTYHFFSEAMNRHVVEKVSMEHNLRLALDRQEFTLLYQPQVDLGSGRLIGAEALLRWQNGEHGHVMPSRFIPAAEDAGMIFRIGEWVLRSAFVQARAWRDSGRGALRTAVNISGRQFKQPGFLEVVDGLLRETGVDPSAIEFELTESVVMDKADKTVHTLRELKERGIHLSIDDFGTGYSSLSYLKHFPIDRIKIDRSFVSDIGNNPDGAAIVGAIVAIGRSLNLKVLAEGVENSGQVDFLAEKGCGEAQGHYFAKPMTAGEFTMLLAGKNPPAGPIRLDPGPGAF